MSSIADLSGVHDRPISRAKSVLLRHRDGLYSARNRGYRRSRAAIAQASHTSSISGAGGSSGAGRAPTEHSAAMTVISAIRSNRGYVCPRARADLGACWSSRQVLQVEQDRMAGAQPADMSCRFVAAAANDQLVGAAFDAAVDRALLAPGHGAAVGDRAAAAGRHLRPRPGRPRPRVAPAPAPRHRQAPSALGPSTGRPVRARAHGCRSAAAQPGSARGVSGLACQDYLARNNAAAAIDRTNREGADGPPYPLWRLRRAA